MRWANNWRGQAGRRAGGRATHNDGIGLVIDAAVLGREAYLQRHLSGPYFGLQRNEDGRAAHLISRGGEGRGQRGGVEAAMDEEVAWGLRRGWFVCRESRARDGVASATIYLLYCMTTIKCDFLVQPVPFFSPWPAGSGTRSSHPHLSSSFPC